MWTGVWYYGGPNDALGLRGRLTFSGASGLTGTWYQTYDAAGRVTQSTQGTWVAYYTMYYSYNQAGGLETFTYPSGRTVKTCYDGSGQPDMLTGTAAWAPTNPLNYATGVSYAVSGAVQQMTSGEGFTSPVCPRFPGGGMYPCEVSGPGCFVQLSGRLCQFCLRLTKNRDVRVSLVPDLQE
jgi:hypothetical protein